jgi:hypothetical protein
MPDGLPTYAIVDWGTFENCRTREVKTMNWISLPVTLSPDCVGFLMSRPNGLRNYGLFVWLVQIAANMPKRGVLEDARGPLTAKRIAMMIRATEQEVEEGLKSLSDPEIGLISRSCTTSHDVARIPCMSDVSVCPVVSVPESEQTPSVKQATGSANRFIADRQIRTGNTPPGFLEFYNAYPTGFKSDRDGMLALWSAQGLESDAQTILNGLAAWTTCERWREGFIVEARKFIETRKWLDEPPPPKPKASTDPKGLVSSDDAVAAYWARQKAKGVTRDTQ